MKTSGTFAVNGQVKGEYGDSAFPVVRAQHQGRQRRLPVSRSPAPGAGHLRRPLAHQPRRQRRQHRRQARPLPPAARRATRSMRAMVLRTPVSDPDVDARVKGKVDLADVRRTRQARGIDQLTGTVAADAAVRTRMSYVDKKQYDKVARQRHAWTWAASRSRARRCRIRSRSSRRRSRWRPERAQLTSFSRHDRQQRPPGVGHAREPARLRLARRHPARHRDGAEQPVQPGRVAVGRGRPAGHPGAAQDRLRARRDRGRADLRQAQDDQRARQAPGQGPAGHPGRLPDEHAGRRDRADRLLRDDQPGQADVRRGPQDDQGGHPVGLPGVHDRADAGARWPSTPSAT